MSGHSKSAMESVCVNVWHNMLTTDANKPPPLIKEAH